MAEPCWNHAGETTKSLLRLWAAICEVQGTALFFDWSRYAKISHSSFGPQVPWRSQINCRKSGRFRICAYINHISIHIYIYTYTYYTYFAVHTQIRYCLGQSMLRTAPGKADMDPVRNLCKGGGCSCKATTSRSEHTWAVFKTPVGWWLVQGLSKEV